MANKFYDSGARRADKVGELFARIAPRYDLINDLQSFGLHRRWKRHLVKLARGRPGERALDVCCGTGDLALGLARKGLDVVGLDFSEPMLEIARHRAGRLQRGGAVVSNSETIRSGQRTAPPAASAQAVPGGLQFLHGDAQRLPFNDCTFGIVTVGYGLRNLADWKQGVREMHRVATRGGRLLVLDFGKPENRLWRAVYFSYLRLFVPLLGLVFCGDASAYAYILESLLHYPAQQGVADYMRQLGLARVDVVDFLGGVMSINYGEKV
ncbi:MAG TPA: class I SAM-dependent methyltransferase [Verrucomicrobiae bacterium]